MALSFTEKQHWKNRIEKIVEGKIFQLKSHSANVISDIKAGAKVAIEDELNISDELAEYAHRAEEIANLEQKQRDLLNMLAAEVYAGELPYRVDLNDVQKHVKKLVRERTESLFSVHPLGKHMELLQNEKARLLDEVLLAGNSQQITRLLDLADELQPLPELPVEPVVTVESPVEAPALLLSDYSIQ